MKPTLWLRIAAAITLLLGLGHLMGRPWTPTNDPLALVVVGAMQAHSMHVMGFDRTFMDFYVGFGTMLDVALFVQAALLWIAAALVAVDRVQARRMTAVFLLANVAQTILAAVYLFTAPLVMSLVVTLCLGAAVVGMRQAPSVQLSTP